MRMMKRLVMLIIFYMMAVSSAFCEANIDKKFTVKSPILEFDYTKMAYPVTDKPFGFNEVISENPNVPKAIISQKSHEDDTTSDFIVNILGGIGPIMAIVVMEQVFYLIVLFTQYIIRKNKAIDIVVHAVKNGKNCLKNLESS